MTASTVVDLVFKLLGSTISQDHGYALYAAVARIVPEVHAADDLGIFPVRASSTAPGLLRLGAASVLRFRLKAERFPTLLPLAGKSLAVDGHALHVGVPRVFPLIPAPVLTSALVTIRLAKPQRGRSVCRG